MNGDTLWSLGDRLQMLASADTETLEANRENLLAGLEIDDKDPEIPTSIHPERHYAKTG